MLYRTLAIAALALGFCRAGLAGDAAVTRFQDVRIFDGWSGTLSGPRNVLVHGFTAVRDVGGPSFGLKCAVDDGIVTGPRIFLPGAIMTMTGGHGDLRQPFEVPRTPGATQSRGERTGAAMIADSPDEARVRVREHLMLGASHLKLHEDPGKNLLVIMKDGRIQTNSLRYFVGASPTAAFPRFPRRLDKTSRTG
jgi:hypothetical protein